MDDSNSSTQIISLEDSDLEVPRLYSLISLIFAGENISPNAHLTVVLSNDKHLHQLNRDFRHIDRATDVLSFPADSEGMPSEIILLGDIFISLEHAAVQAAYYDATLQQEVERLLTHGVLHLLGYDHVLADDELRMQRKTEDYLQQAWQEEKC